MTCLKPHSFQVVEMVSALSSKAICFHCSVLPGRDLRFYLPRRTPRGRDVLPQGEGGPQWGLLTTCQRPPCLGPTPSSPEKGRGRLGEVHPCLYGLRNSVSLAGPLQTHTHLGRPLYERVFLGHHKPPRQPDLGSQLCFT